MKRNFTEWIITAFVLLLALVFLFPAVYSPTIKIDKSRKCRFDMNSILYHFPDFFDTVQETADAIRQCNDPWKHNYNAIVADEFARKTFGNAATGDIIIWSSGPNGINENGGGDDIVCDGDWTDFGGPPMSIDIPQAVDNSEIARRSWENTGSDTPPVANDSQTNAVPQESGKRDGGGDSEP